MNPGSAVYGAITAGTLLAAETPLRATYVETLGSVMIALALYWLAHAYSTLLGGRFAAGDRLSAGRLRAALVFELPLLFGAALPLAALCIAWLAGASLTDAVIAAVWTSAATIVAIEIATGVRGHLSAGELVGQTIVGAALGLPIILLRVILH